MVKVLQVIAGAEKGGAEAFFLRLCIALNNRGVEQQVLTRPFDERMNQLSSAGIPFKIAKFGSLFDFSTSKNIERLKSEFMPDIILSWMNRATNYCSSKKNNFGSIHVARLGGYYNLKYYRNCDYLIGNTNGIYNFLINNGWSKENCIHLPNFASNAKPDIIKKESLNTPVNAITLFSAGRLHKNKAFDTLIGAVSKISKVHLWLAGDGPLKTDLIAQVKKLNISDRVHFLGWRDDISGLYNASDIFVCPSRHEPLGNVILESWSHRKPVIAASSQGPSELINDGINGLVFSIDNESELVGCIKKLISDSNLREDLANNGYKLFNQFYSEKVVTNKFIDFFNKIKKNKECVE